MVFLLVRTSTLRSALQFTAFSTCGKYKTRYQTCLSSLKMAQAIRVASGSLVEAGIVVPVDLNALGLDGAGTKHLRMHVELL